MHPDIMKQLWDQHVTQLRKTFVNQDQLAMQISTSIAVAGTIQRDPRFTQLAAQVCAHDSHRMMWLALFCNLSAWIIRTCETG